MVHKTVYVVDDSEIVLSLTTAALEAAGFRVISMDRWEKLDDALQQFRPDLILMDINMPEMTGDFVLSFFKEERGLTDVPILLFSDIDEDELARRASDCGADGYVAKQWGVECLLEEVNRRLLITW